MRVAGSNVSRTTLVSVYRATRRLPGDVCRVDDPAISQGHLRLVGQRTVSVSNPRGSSHPAGAGRWTTLVVSRAVSRWRRRPKKNFGFVVVWTDVDGTLSSSSVVGRRRAYLMTYDVDRAVRSPSAVDLVKDLPTLPTQSTIRTTTMMTAKAKFVCRCEICINLHCGT